MCIQWKFLAVLLGASAAFSSHAAELAFSSASDFTEINLELKNHHGANPDAVQLDVTLSPEAQARAEKVSRKALNQTLTLFIDGQKISSATVRGVMTTSQMRISVSRETALQWVSGFLAQSAPAARWCGAAGSAATPHTQFRVPCPSTNVVSLPSLQAFHALRISQGHISCRDRLEPAEIGRVAVHCFDQYIRAH